MRLLYFFPRPAADDLKLIAEKQAPSDRLYGLVELGAYGHKVSAADGRFLGRVGAVVRWLRRRGANVCDVRTLASLRHYDVIIVKDGLSTLLTVFCRLTGRPIVYLDALWEVPRRAWKRALSRLNLLLADAVVVYSTKQIEVWSQKYRVPRERFKRLPYTIDTDFCRPVPPSAVRTSRPYVLSVGRDGGRNFATLVQALDGLGLDLKLVTLPYLLKNVDTVAPWIQVLQRISYDELHELYANALIVAIPLHEGLISPSGIRGLLEAMALEKPVVATRTPTLEEYVSDGEGLIYVEPGDTAGLSKALVRLRDDGALREELVRRGTQVVRERYNMHVFARALEQVLDQVASR